MEPKPMTPDTERAVFALKPLCDALHIKIWADENRLYMNGQAIGISCNSTWATLMEAVGYIFLKCYDRNFRRGALNPGQIDCVIKRYWIPKPVSDATEKTAARWHMGEIIEFPSGYNICEVICIGCKHRWIAVYPDGVLLKELQCPSCKEQGYVIQTGQEITEEDIKP